MKTDFDVIVVGELNVDVILNGIEGFPEIGKEIIADDLTITIGSSSAIFACNLSTLGPKVAFTGKVGCDGFAKIIFEGLKDKGIDTSNIKETLQYNTGVTIVLNYNEDRANVTYPGAMSDFALEDINFDVISKGKHLHFSSYFLQPQFKNDIVLLFKKAKELGLTTSLDPQWDPAEKWDMPIEELLPYVDIFFPNKIEIQNLTQSGSIEESIEKLKSKANYIVVKNGSEGAIGWNGDEVIYQQSFLNKNIMDCIGAGDSFNAGFIFKFINNCSFHECMKFGALTGAINTTQAGGTTAFSSIENIKEIASREFNYTM